jgi:peptidoglycan DL-endopeptidase CwlO
MQDSKQPLPVVRLLPRKLRHWMAASAAAGAMAVPGAAHACCNDFWSCGAAFVTGGLSCAVQAAQDESRRILDAARRALDNSRRAYDEAVNGTRNKATESRDKAQQDSRESLGAMDAAKNTVQAKLSAPPRAVLLTASNVVLPAGTVVNSGQATLRSPAPGSLIATAPAASPAPAPAPTGALPIPALPNPPSPEEVRRALEDAARTIDSLRQRGQDQDLPAVSQAIARMNDSMGRSLGNLNGIVRMSVFTPLEEILRVLGMADPTGLTNLIAASVTGLDAATTALDTEVFRAMQSLDDVMVGALGEVETRVSELVSSADLARAIQSSVNALSEQPTQAQVSALRSLLPAEPSRPMAATAIRSIRGISISPALRLSLTAPKAAPAANTMKLALGPLSNQLKDPLLKTRLQAPADKMQFKTQIDRYLGNEFAGLAGAPRAAKRQQLVDEARRRFGSNPQQAQEMERLISQAAGPIMIAPAAITQPSTIPQIVQPSPSPLVVQPAASPLIVPQRPMAPVPAPIKK